MNHLEQLIAEWLEYKGFFVRRNIKVGKRAEGGYECELDVVGFHPQQKKLVQYEPSTDSHKWAKREERYKKKFDAGKKYIPSIFSGMQLPSQPDQYAVFLIGSSANHANIAGGKVLMVEDLVKEIVDDLKTKPIMKGIVPEQFPLLRMIHLTCEYSNFLWNEK